MQGFKILWLIDWLPVIVLNAFFNGISVILRCTCPCLSGVLLTSTLHNILSKPLAAFPQNHCQKNGQLWQRNESCRNDYHQSLERILAEPGIEPATSWFQVCNATNWAMGLGIKQCEKRRKCWLQAFSPFPTMFSEGTFLQSVKSCQFEINGFLTIWFMTSHPNSAKQTYQTFFSLKYNPNNFSFIFVSTGVSLVPTR